jgi:hypothetical protein
LLLSTLLLLILIDSLAILFPLLLLLSTLLLLILIDSLAILFPLLLLILAILLGALPILCGALICLQSGLRAALALLFDALLFRLPLRFARLLRLLLHCTRLLSTLFLVLGFFLFVLAALFTAAAAPLRSCDVGGTDEQCNSEQCRTCEALVIYFH